MICIGNGGVHGISLIRNRKKMDLLEFEENREDSYRVRGDKMVRGGSSAFVIDERGIAKMIFCFLFCKVGNQLKFVTGKGAVPDDIVTQMSMV